MEKMENYYNKETGSFMYEPNSKEFWQQVLEDKKNKTIITSKVIALNYNGIIIDYKGFRAFMPEKQISTQKLSSFEKFLDKDIDFIITDFDPLKDKIIISHKEIELIEKKKEEQKLIESISVGHVYDGKIVSLKDFGAFVKLSNGITGLLHISQVSHTKIKKLDAVLSINQEVKVKVIKNENGKISLSMKALEKPENNNQDEAEIEVDYKKYITSEDISTSLDSLFDKFNI